MFRMTMRAGRQSRNALASPLGEEGHEVAQGCTTLQAEKTLYASLTANRQPSSRLVFTTDCFICFEYRPSLAVAQDGAGRSPEEHRNILLT